MRGTIVKIILYSNFHLKLHTSLSEVSKQPLTSFCDSILNNYAFLSIQNKLNIFVAVYFSFEGCLMVTHLLIFRTARSSGVTEQL